MDVSFLENRPLNSVIVDSDERPLYEVHTPKKLVGPITTIRRLEPGVASGTGEIIAEIHWQSLGTSTITLFGATMAVKDWLRRDGALSSSRVFTAKDGISYKWSHSRLSMKIILQNTSTSVEVAQAYRRKLGLFGEPQKKMKIEISPEATHLLDSIIVSFIIVEEKARRAASG